MEGDMRKPVMMTLLLLGSNGVLSEAEAPEIVHDVEYYILYEQHAERWAAE
jgi:hypothetical protein